MPVPFLTCMAAVASFYQLPPRVLPSIQATEGGQVGMVSHNPNGTDDLGLMQVNTSWVQPIAARSGMSEQEVRDRLVNDGCYNIAVAGLILRGCLNETRGNLMRAVGYYHSHAPARGQAYRVRMINSALALYFPPKRQR
jgi:hypothetical protein